MEVVREELNTSFVQCTFSKSYSVWCDYNVWNECTRIVTLCSHIL